MWLSLLHGAHRVAGLCLEEPRGALSVVGTEEIAAVIKTKQAAVVLPWSPETACERGLLSSPHGVSGGGIRVSVHRKEDRETITELWAVHSPPWGGSCFGGQWLELEGMGGLLGGSTC